MVAEKGKRKSGSGRRPKHPCGKQNERRKESKGF